MKEKDREIRIGEHRFYLAEDNMLYITIVGKQDEQTALAIKAGGHRRRQGSYSMS